MLPAVELYRAEREAARARGAQIDLPHPHPVVPWHDGKPNYTWKPAVSVGDGCYLVTRH